VKPRATPFLAKNPNGKIPVLELEDGTYLWESNAILNFLADASVFLPTEPRLRTQVLQWQFFEQYSHEPYIAVARFIQLYQGLPEARRSEYEACHVDGYKALKVMEKQLQRTSYLVGENFSIADIALYA
jgi:glutathione S-transferase